MTRLIALLLLLGCAAVRAEPLAATGTVEPIFTPGGDAEGAIVLALAEARHSIRVQAFLLTSRAVARGLVEAADAQTGERRAFLVAG